MTRHQRRLSSSSRLGIVRFNRQETQSSSGSSSGTSQLQPAGESKFAHIRQAGVASFWSANSQVLACGPGFRARTCAITAVPLVPKWLAWYGIWVGFMFIAECLMPYFMNGAFARSGILNFWIEFLIWMAWVPVLTYVAIKAVGRIEQENAAN